MQLLESCIWLEKEDKGERQLGTERERERERAEDLVWIIPPQPGMERERNLSHKKSQLMFKND